MRHEKNCHTYFFRAAWVLHVWEGCVRDACACDSNVRQRCWSNVRQPSHNRRTSEATVAHLHKTSSHVCAILLLHTHASQHTCCTCTLCTHVCVTISEGARHLMITAGAVIKKNRRSRTHIYIHAHTYIHVFMYACIYIFIYTFTYIWTHKRHQKKCETHAQYIVTHMQNTLVTHMCVTIHSLHTHTPRLHTCAPHIITHMHNTSSHICTIYHTYAQYTLYTHMRHVFKYVCTTHGHTRIEYCHTYTQ